MNTDKLSLNSCSLQQLQDITQSLGAQKFRAAQIYRWLHHDKISSIDEMTNLSKDLRQSIAEIAEITQITEIARSQSKIDGTIKLLFELSDGERVEAVLLPGKERVSACISTQVGCKMGCKFCATAAIGFKRNLQTAEILAQIKHLELIAQEEGLHEEARLSGIVFMGMGEPLDNLENLSKALEILTNENGYDYSHKRLTVSTVGLVPAIRTIFEGDTPIRLAVSVNAPNQSIRSEIMPISQKYSLEMLVNTIKSLPLKKREQITFEYVLLAGVNDKAEHAQELLKLCADLPVKINLIRFNGDSAEYSAPSEKNVLAFQKILTDNGLSAFIRRSLGADILGACGQLAARYKGK